MNHIMLDTISKYNMLAPGDGVIVGFSGGADSSALLFALLRLRERLALKITAAHINHGFRGAESDGDEAFCAETCARYGVDFISYKIDVRAEARRRRVSDEEAGRAARYECFERALKERNADKIAVAHNKDDNAETVVMRLLRGAGARGLSGIPPVRGRVIRPLINVSRAEIEDFCRENGIKYRNDSTNSQPVYNRNRVRLQVMPLLAGFNPSAADALTQAAALVSDDDAYLEALTREWLKAHAVFSGGRAELELRALAAAPPPIARRAVRAAFEFAAAGSRDLSYRHVEDALSICRKSSGKTLHLPRNIRCYRQYDSIIIKKDAALSDSYCYILPFDECVYLDKLEKYAILRREDIRILPPGPGKKLKYVCTKTFCYDRIKGNVEFRTRKNGDRIYFRSIGGNKLISRYLSDIKMPREARGATPLLANGREVMCVFHGTSDEGFNAKTALSDAFKPDDPENAGKANAYLQFWEEEY